MKKICKICGCEFNGRPNKVYCSIPCRRAAEKIALQARLRAYFDEQNPGFWQAGSNNLWEQEKETI